MTSRPDAPVALVLGARAYGAVERYAEALVRALAARGEPVLVLHPDVPAFAPLAVLAGPGVRVESFPEALLDSAPAALRGLAARLRRHGPRAAHVVDVWPAALLAARLARVPRVLVTHHTPELPLRDNAVGALLRRLAWLTRPLVVYTSETDRATDGLRPRSVVVPLGIDLDRFDRPRPARPAGGPVVGNVARLAAQKGHDTLVAAAALVLERRPDVRFVVAGDGELRVGLEQRAAPLGDRFAWLGERDDVPELLAGFDVFAFPSRFEGLCLAVIEAQAAGVPVVATPVGGIRETVVDGVTGLLVPVDDAEALAAAILALLDDPDSAHRLAAEARRRVRRRFSLERMADETIRLYGGPAG